MADAVEDEQHAEQQHGDRPHRDSNRIQVSATKKPMFFYVTLSKRLLKEHDEVQLSALGTAVSTMVSVAEILKKEGYVVEKGLSTDLEGIEEREGEGRPSRPAYKPKMTVVLGKSEGFDQKMAEEAAHAKERAAARKERAAQHAGEEGEGEGEGGRGREGGHRGRYGRGRGRGRVRSEAKAEGAAAEEQKEEGKEEQVGEEGAE